MSYTYVTAFTGNIISFIAGMSVAWSSPEGPKLEDPDATPFEAALSKEETSWISALISLGAAFGPFIYGYLADRIGRRLTLLICGVPFVICYIVLAFAKIPALFYVCRFIMGLSIGGVFTVIPVYLTEIAEDSNRGAIASSMNCFICGGMLFTYVTGPYVSIMVFNLILLIFPVAFLLLFFFLAPESPHYYVSNDKHDLAKSALQKIRGGNKPEHIEKELMTIEARIKGEGRGTFLDIFKSKGLIKAFIISAGLLTFQQFSGVNVVQFYAQSIFEQAGTSLEPAVCSILIGGVQFGASFVTPLVVERLGRRVLLIFSAVGMLISEAALGTYGYLKDHGTDVSSVTFLPILCLIGYIITYNIGFGPLAWAVMGEVFPSNVKSAAASACTTICWSLSFLLTKFFQSVSDSIGMGPSFWIFASFCLVAVPFCLLYVIETKGKSLKEIQDALNR